METCAFKLCKFKYIGEVASFYFFYFFLPFLEKVFFFFSFAYLFLRVGIQKLNKPLLSQNLQSTGMERTIKLIYYIIYQVVRHAMKKNKEGFK